MKLRTLALLGLVVLAACDRQAGTPVENSDPSFAKGSQGTGDPAILSLMANANQKLRARGLSVAVEAINYFTLGVGRPSNRIHQQEFRWVPNDPRRVAQGNDITFLISTNEGTTASGLTEAQTTGAIRRAFATWSADAQLDKVDVMERPYPGGDVTVFDELIDQVTGSRFDDFRGQAGNPFIADIVNAG